MTPASPVILFDGVCNLCNNTVQFILKRDKKKQFLFGSLQGKAGQQLLRQFNLPTADFNSFVLAEGDRFYTRSTAVLRMLKRLGGGWSLLYGFIVVPKFIRDGIYNWVARNRYKWYGRRDECMIPTPELKARFLDGGTLGNGQSDPPY
ncbi:MAG: thiol-disulfide oxidoreductase DCC family protein [Chitinophagaceae bacterium]